MLPVPLDLGFSLEHCTFIRETITGRTREVSSMPGGGRLRRPHDAKSRFPATRFAGRALPVSPGRHPRCIFAIAIAVECRNNENHEKSN
jgi:hypothetical protein